MKTLKLSLCLPAILLVAKLASATLVGPYTPDANTLYLMHFDEPAGGSMTTNVGLKAGNFYTVTNTSTGIGLASPPAVTTLLGYASYAGFGNAVSGTNIDGLADGVVGYDGNKSGVFDADTGDGSGNGVASPDAIAITNFNIGNGGQTPFTMEAIIRPTAINVNQEIICTDDSHGTRGFQFKITSTGTLQFNDIPVGGGSVSFPIPTTGTHKFVSGNWYHVAATYNGTVVKLYWTLLDPSVGADNLLGSQNTTYGNSAAVVPLVIGAENRGANGESFRGLIDEVRISSVARADNQMQFFSPTVTISGNPLSQNIDDGMLVTFNVTASSLTALGYQWRFNLAPISGATNTSYSIASVVLPNAGSYDVVVTNISGSSSTSAPAILVVGAGNFLAHRYSFTADTTDSIGGATGTNFGDATVNGGALVLDGTSGTYMQLPSGLLHGQQAATFDFWANYGTSAGNNEHVFDFGNTNGTSLGVSGQPNNYLFFSPHSGTVHRLTATGGTIEFEQTATGSNILDGKNLHVTCVVDPPDNYLAIYTNGVLEIANTNFSVPFASLDDQLAFIGRSLFSTLNSDAYLTASIDELRIYNGALSANSVLQSDLQGVGNVLNDGPVQLVAQPGSAATAPGLTVNFSGLATGHQPITYQWLENGSAITGATNSTYSFAATAGQNGHAFALIASNSVTGTNYAVASTNAILSVVTPPTLVWLGVNGTAWDTSTLNWTNISSLSLVAYGLLDSAVFNDLGSGQPTVDLGQALNPLSLTVNSTANYTLISSAQNGALTGSGSLIKANTGTLTIDVTNNMTGPVLISGGTVQIGNNDTLGAIGGPVTNNASLVLDRSDTMTLSSQISGTGTLTMNSGNVTVSGSNSYSGATFINSGVTFLQSATGLGATNGGITVNNNGELYVTANVDLGPKALSLVGSGVSSAGALRKGGAGITAIYGPVTLTADTTLSVDSGATLNLTNAAGINGTVANANLTLAGAGAGNIAGPLSLGIGSLTVGGGTWTVAPSNNFSGLSTVNAGALRITGAQSLGPVPASFNPSEVTLNGGALEAGNNVTLNDGNIGISLTLNSTITADTNVTFVISNQISGSGSVALTKAGPGRLVLNGANPFSGTLNVDTAQASAGNDGMLVIANNAAIQNLTVFAGIPFINIRNENGATSTLGLDGTLGGVTVNPDIGVNGRNNAVPAVENLAGNNTIAGNITLGVGGGVYSLQSDSGVLTLTAPLPYATPTSSGRTLTFQGAGTISMAAAIQDGSNNGSSNVWDNVIKAGTGLLSLPVANTYSGFTTVSNGVLSLTGSLNSLAGVTVAGGLLVGNGTITGPVTISGGAIEAGDTNTIGTLNFAGPLVLGGNTIVKISKTGPANDQFSGQTSITYGGTLTVTNLAGTLALGNSFTLFNPGASASNFSSIAGSPGSGLAYSFTNGVLSVVHGAASNPTNITVNVTGNTLNLSWPADHLGWILQSQTNALNSGLGTNWVDVSGSSSVTQEVIPVTPANPSVFYRLRNP